MKTLKRGSSRRGSDSDKEAEDNRRVAAIARLTKNVTDADVRRALKRSAALRQKSIGGRNQC